MSTQKLFSGDKARRLLLQGVDDLANPVGATLGPRGRNVTISKLINGLYMPHVTKDGVTVARSIIPQWGDDWDVRATGANAVKQASVMTASEAGDGTTSSTVLAQAFCHAGVKLVAQGRNPHHVREGMEAAVRDITAKIQSMSVPLNMIKNGIYKAALISSNYNSHIAEHVAQAYHDVDNTGLVVIDRSKTSKTHVESVRGTQVAGGCHPMFFNDPKGRSVHEDPVIFVTTDIIAKFADIEAVGNYASGYARPLIIIAEQVIGEAYGFLVHNVQQGKLRCVIINLADYGDRKVEVMKDIVAVVGGIVTGKSQGKLASKSNENHWGGCSKIEVYDNRTVFIGGKGDSGMLAQRIMLVNQELEDKETDEEKEWIRRRLASLAGAISCIYVGASTDVETAELYDKFDDAVRSVSCALKQGVVPGGGYALMYVSKNSYRQDDNTDFGAGYNALLDAVLAPIQRICQNASPEPETEEVSSRARWIKSLFASKNTRTLYDDVSEKMDGATDPFYGIDIRNMKVVDLREAGILDPTIVTTSALKNAMSAAGGIITSSHVIVNL